jgi:hypothetical protein
MIRYSQLYSYNNCYSFRCNESEWETHQMEVYGVYQDLEVNIARIAATGLGNQSTGPRSFSSSNQLRWSAI